MKTLAIIWTLVIIVGALAFSFINYATAPVHADQGVCLGYPDGVCESCTIGQCNGKDITPPDPNRPYFDGWGNEFSYNGSLIKAAPCTTDPINHQPNPYSCNTPMSQSPPTSIQPIAPISVPGFGGKQ